MALRTCACVRVCVSGTEAKIERVCAAIKDGRAEEMEDKMLEQQQMVMFVSILFFLQPSHMRHHFYFLFFFFVLFGISIFLFCILAARIRDPNRIGKLDTSAAECARDSIEYIHFLFGDIVVVRGAWCGA